MTLLSPGSKTDKTEYNEIVTRGTKDIVTGAPVKDTVDKMAADIDKALAKYKYR